MAWDEFCTLVSGLMPDTPLGNVVAIRAEQDPKVIKGFTVDQRRIHRDWRARQADGKLADPKRLDQEMAALGQAFAVMFGGGGGGVG